MNPYLAKLRGLNFEKEAPSGTAKTDKTYIASCERTPDATRDRGFVSFGSSKGSPFSKNEPPFGGAPRPAPASRFRAVLRILEGRCPDHVEPDRWQQAVADGQRFLSQWGEQAAALGWTKRDLFGLHTPPDQPAPSYRRLSRYDCTGLVWLLQGREVIALTADTAAIRWPSGSVTVYRKNNKPALGPVGDSLDDFE